MSLKNLYTNSSGSPTTSSKTSTKETKKSSLGSLLDNTTIEQTTSPQPEAPTQVQTPNVSAPIIEVTPDKPFIAPKKPSLFSRVTGAFSKSVEAVTGRPDYEKKPASSSVVKNMFRELPSAITETILPGVKALRDNPELVYDQNIGTKDLAKELPGQVAEAGKQFIKAPISGALNLTGTPTKVNVPGLGEVTNSQYEASRRIAEGEDPVIATISEGGNAILNSLFFFGLASKAFTPRPSAISAKGEVAVPKDSGLPVEKGARSFRLYEQPAVTRPIDPVTLKKIAVDNKISISTDYNPKNPTYFKMSGVKADGKVTGQFFQLKPSYFETFKTKLGGNPGRVPNNQIIPIIEVKRDVAEIKNIPLPKTPTKLQERFPAGSLTVSPETAPAQPKNLMKLAEDAGVSITPEPTPAVPISAPTENAPTNVPVEPQNTQTPTVVEPNPQETSQKKYYIQTYNGKGDSSSFAEVQGKPIEISNGLDTFIHKGTDGIYVVTEGRSGMKLSTGAKTRSLAIEQAKNQVTDYIKKGGNIEDLIKSQIEKRGLSPRYAETKQAVDTNKPIYKRGDIVVDDDGRRLEITSGNDGKYPNEALRSMNEGYVRARVVGEKDDFIWYTSRISKKVEPKKLFKTQKAKVADTIKEQPKTIKEIAQETNIKEPNVRRILGVGAKDGTFARVDKGVYKLTIDGQDLAYIETGNAVEILPRLAKDGFKSDMVFLDIPYDTPAIKGGNRGMEYNLISVDEFGKILDSVKEIARTPDSPVIHMFSQAPSGMKAMQKYNNLFLEKGFVPVGKGELQKTFKDGRPVTNVRGKVSEPEGILVFNQSGKLQKDLKNLNFKLVRPKGYQSEKPAEMLKAMIEMTTNEGDVVLDPFAGSGVTGAEAIKARRKAFLIEKNPDVAKNVTQPRVEKALKPSTATTPQEVRKERKALGFADAEVGHPNVMPKFNLEKADIKAILKNSVEFRNNPVLTVEKKDGSIVLAFKGEKQTFRIKASAMGLKEENLKVGEKISVNPDDFSLANTGRSLRVYNGENIEASLAGEFSEGKIAPAQSVDELTRRIEQLNKFGQSHAILRRTGGLNRKKALGIFRGKDRGTVHLRDEVVKSEQQYMEVLAHELGHALEYTLTGATNKDMYKVFGRDLSPEIKKKIREELKVVTNSLVGEEFAKNGAGYYYKDTELLARFLQKMFQSPGNISELAPTAVEYFERSAVENPIVGEYLDAVRGTIDKGERKTIIMRDMKETYQKVLGKRVGTMAWNDEMRYRAMKERAKIQIEKLIKDKFKNVKDDPALLFQTAEAIKVTKNEVPEFGTRDFANAKNEKEVARLLETGYEPVLNDGSTKAFDLSNTTDGEWEMNGKYVYDVLDGKMLPRFAKSRYTPEQGKALFEQLSSEGKQLIKDFTASKAEAKDYFNREMIKDVNKINSNLEGWVHHYWDETGVGIGKDRLKTKVASAKKQRLGAEGYVEDLQKAMTKAITELETTKVYNSFIDEYFARVTEPIAKGQGPKPGYVEVVGNVKKGGVGTSFEMKGSIMKDGKSTPIERPRYQMPAVIYERYKMITDVAVEASTATQIMNSINRYWRVNILFHPGSAMTNFISGGIQYSTKVLTDFYTELLTGNLKLEKTRRDIASMIRVLTPKGWEDAPDWAYGGDLSNYYGEFMTTKSPGVDVLNKSVDAYADKTLKFYGKVERYWKKVISLSEGAGDLKSLGTMTKEGLRLPTEEEKQLLNEINSEVDLFAYDYDNVPVWLQNYSQGFFGQAVKPFAKYPYKYAKHVTELATAVFDRTQPKEERMAKLLALGTIMALYAYIRSKRKEDKETPEVDETAPASVSTRGRFFIGTDSEGKELFTRTAKYPFVNLTETGAQFLEGNSNTGFQSINDMLGSIAPVGKITLAMLGYRNEYEQYVPYSTILGKDLASFVPGTRILADLSRFFDPYQRKPKTFMQGFTSLVPLPTASEDLRAKLRGEIKAIRVPLEGEIEANAGEGTKRTTTDMYVRNYKTDILMGLLGGIYINRIDPEVGKAFIIRKQENAEKSQKKEEESKPVSMLKEAGGAVKSLFSVKKASASAVPEDYVEPKQKTHYIRNNPVTESDLEEAKAVLYAEISNRDKTKQQLEAQTILNTAFNRQEHYNKTGYRGRNDWTLTDVLQEKSQYQGYEPNGRLLDNGKTIESQYQKLKANKLTEISQQKIEAIDSLLEKVRDGSFVNNISDYRFYTHKPDGRIIATKTFKKLFK